MTELELMRPHQLRAIRRRLDLNQQEFGELMGYPANGAKSRISELENGRRRITIIRAMRARQLDAREIPPREIRLATKREMGGI